MVDLEKKSVKGNLRKLGRVEAGYRRYSPNCGRPRKTAPPFGFVKSPRDLPFVASDIPVEGSGAGLPYPSVRSPGMEGES
jgi:hypothetical protein